VAAALAHFRATPPQGECTLVLGGAPAAVAPRWRESELRAELRALVASGLSSKEAARELAGRSGHGRRELYALLHAAEPTGEPGADGTAD
jgi:16S rRNA (cytidine1402-2'-O)-methyltransferase